MRKLFIGILSVGILVGTFVSGMVLGKDIVRNETKNLVNPSILGMVIEKNESAIKMEIPNGGQKVILISPSTTVRVSSPGNLDEIDLYKMITVRYSSQNEDQSLNATVLTVLPRE